MSSGSLRVALISPEYPPVPGGVGDYTSCLAAALVRSGEAEVHVIASAGGDGSPQVAFPGAGCAGALEAAQVRVHRNVARWDWSSWGALERILGSIGADVAVIQYQTAAFGLHGAINTLPRWLSRRKSNPAVVTTFHDLREPFLFRGAGGLRRHANLELMRGSRAIVVTNPEDLAALPPNFVGKAWPIPIGPNVVPMGDGAWSRAGWRNERHIADDTILIGYFGFINSSKGLDTLVDALGLLRDDSDRRYELLIVGGDVGQSDATNSATAAEIKGRISERGLTDLVRWTGYLTPDGVSQALLSSDMAVLPFLDGASFRRGSLLAALSHSLPVVTTRPQAAPVLAGWPQLVNGENALLVEPDNADELAAAIRRAATDYELRKHLSAGAAELAHWFSWDRIAARYIELFRWVGNRSVAPVVS